MIISGVGGKKKIFFHRKILKTKFSRDDDDKYNFYFSKFFVIVRTMQSHLTTHGLQVGVH